MKQTIAIDMDDVLADSTDFWRKEVNKRANLSLEPHHWKVPGEYSKYYETIWKTHGVEHLISIDDIDAVMVKDQSEILPTPEAVNVLRELHKRYELVIVTARNPSQHAATRAWIDQGYPGLFEQVYFTRNTDIDSPRTKGEICAEIGASWLIDDSPGHCKDALNHNVNAILYGTYGWHIDIPEGVVQCKTWNDIKKYFDEQRSR